MSTLLDEIRHRLRQLFLQLQGGDDAPPALRLRTEGLMEAAQLTGQAKPEEMLEEMEAIYREVYQRDITEDFGVGWREFYPFPQIPAMGLRAPVYPSTRN